MNRDSCKFNKSPTPTNVHYNKRCHWSPTLHGWLAGASMQAISCSKEEFICLSNGQAGVKYHGCDEELTVRSNVRHIHASIAFADDIHLVPSQIKSVDKVRPELHELHGNVVLVLGGGRALREAGADGLVDPDDVCQAVPSIRVLDRCKRSVLPEEGAVLLEETLERRASGLEAGSC